MLCLDVLALPRFVLNGALGDAAPGHLWARADAHRAARGEMGCRGPHWSEQACDAPLRARLRSRQRAPAAVPRPPDEHANLAGCANLGELHGSQCPATCALRPYLGCTRRPRALRCWSRCPRAAPGAGAAPRRGREQRSHTPAKPLAHEARVPLPPPVLRRRAAPPSGMPCTRRHHGSGGNLHPKGSTAIHRVHRLHGHARRGGAAAECGTPLARRRLRGGRRRRALARSWRTLRRTRVAEPSDARCGASRDGGAEARGKLLRRGGAEADAHRAWPPGARACSPAARRARRQANGRRESSSP